MVLKQVCQLIMESDSRKTRNSHDLSSIGKDLIRNGVVDTQKVYYILNNPNEPRAQLTITAILKKYQEHKRKALAEKRNNHFSETVNKRWDLFTDGHVELSQCPKEVIQHIIKETFEPMQLDESSSFVNSEASSHEPERTTTIPRVESMAFPPTQSIRVKPEPVEVVTILETSNLTRSSSTSSLCKDKAIDEFAIMAEKYKDVLVEEKDVENDAKLLSDDIKKLERDRDQAQLTVERLTKTIQDMNNKLHSLEKKLVVIKEKKIAVQKEMIAKTVIEEASLPPKTIPSGQPRPSASSRPKPVQQELPSTTQCEIIASSDTFPCPKVSSVPKKIISRNARRDLIPDNGYKNDKDERKGRKLVDKPRSRSKEKNQSYRAEDRRSRPERSRSKDTPSHRDRDRERERDKNRCAKKVESRPKPLNNPSPIKCNVAGCFRPFPTRHSLITHLNTAHRIPNNDSFSYCVWGDCHEFKRNCQVMTSITPLCLANLSTLLSRCEVTSCSTLKEDEVLHNSTKNSVLPPTISSKELFVQALYLLATFQ